MLNWVGKKPETPEVGTTWFDVETSTVYVYSELPHNVLDDMVLAIEDREVKHFDWLVLASANPVGQNLYGAIVDEVNFMYPASK